MPIEESSITLMKDTITNDKIEIEKNSGLGKFKDFIIDHLSLMVYLVFHHSYNLIYQVLK